MKYKNKYQQRFEFSIYRVDRPEDLAQARSTISEATSSLTISGALTIGAGSAGAISRLARLRGPNLEVACLVGKSAKAVLAPLKKALNQNEMNSLSSFLLSISNKQELKQVLDYLKNAIDQSDKIENIRSILKKHENSHLNCLVS